MFNKVPEDTILNPKKTILDPSCGNGNFLVEALRMRLDADLPPTQSLATIFGVELQQDNVEECRERLLSLAGDTSLHRKIVNKNIVCEDALAYDYDFR
jgi:23S rRNA G2445 N2-methylase RlmL